MFCENKWRKRREKDLPIVATLEPGFFVETVLNYAAVLENKKIEAVTWKQKNEACEKMFVV